MYKNCFKRLFDFCIALCAFPFVLLVCIGVWIAIKCDDGGPLFHMASRIGKNGRIFKMYKSLIPQLFSLTLFITS